MQKKNCSFDGVMVNYSIKRVSGLFLVFLHGLGGDLNAWKKEMRFFDKKGFSTLAVDLRGHGLSDRPNSIESYKLEHFAKDVHNILKNEKITEFIIIGHCFGGMVAIMFHKLFPGLSKAYILVSTTYKPKKFPRIFNHHPMFIDILNRLLKNKWLRKKHFSHVDFSRFSGTGDWNPRRIYSDITNTSLKSWLFTYENLSKFNGIKILKSIRKPVLIIGGEKDSIFPINVAKKIHGLVKSSKIGIIPEANHIIVINNARALDSEILPYIKSIGNAAPSPDF